MKTTIAHGENSMIWEIFYEIDKNNDLGDQTIGYIYGQTHAEHLCSGNPAWQKRAISTKEAIKQLDSTMPPSERY